MITSRDIDDEARNERPQTTNLVLLAIHFHAIWARHCSTPLKVLDTSFIQIALVKLVQALELFILQLHELLQVEFGLVGNLPSASISWLTHTIPLTS